MTIKVFSREVMAKQRDKVPFPSDLRLRDHVREVRTTNGPIYEFIGTDTFGSEWNERRRYEVDAGREEEPILFEPIYDVISDANLPKNISVQRMGPGGVVLSEIQEGGEVKFATIESSEFSVPIKHYGVGLEYSKDLVAFNELWRVPIIERHVGIAYNALLNHIHLTPFIDFSYTADNQTPANTSGDSTVEDFLLTAEDAITNSRTDSSNPRRGPYVLLISAAQELVVRKALTTEVQQGLAVQSRAIDSIRSIITYDGWTGTRGKKTTTYSGVTSGTGYLISLQYRGQDCQSYMKQDLMQDGTQEDVSRFLTQVVWDTYFGHYVDVDASTEEITWPS